MLISYLDMLLFYSLFILELFNIRFGLASCVLSISRSGFYILLCIIKLILGSLNFVTIYKPYRTNMAGLTDALKPGRFAGENFERWDTRVKF
jgi:hypothetical protein